MTTSFRLRQLRVGPYVVLVLVGVALGFLYPMVTATENEGRWMPGGRPLEALFDPSEPLLIPGREVRDASVAGGILGQDLVAPSQRTASEVWVSPTGEGGMRFGSDLVETIHPIPAGADAMQVYETQAADWGFGYVDTIGGHPAWVIPDHPESTAPGVNSVRIAFDDFEVRLYSRMSIDELVAVGESLTAVGT